MNELTGIILVAIHAPCDVVVLLDDEVRLAPPLRVQRRTRACSVRALVTMALQVKCLYSTLS